MALDTSPKNLRLEVEAAIRYRKRFTDASEPRHQQYTGEFYKEGAAPEIVAHENHAFEHCITTVPSLVFNNPKVNVKSRRPVAHREISQTMAHGLNRWVADVELAETLTEIAFDVQFDFGIALVTMEVAPGYEDRDTPPLRPSVHRVSPRDYFFDPQAKGPLDKRFEGHEWIADLEDLRNAQEIDPETGEKRPMYNKTAIGRLTAQSQDELRPGLERMTEAVDRNQVRVMEVYVREEGMIYTLAAVPSMENAEEQYIREPRKAFCPPWGPYVQFGVIPVPDQALPLPPLATTQGLVEELNAHLDAIAKQCDGCRQFLICNSTNSRLIQAVKGARSGDVLSIPGFDTSQAMEVDLGGPHKEQMQYTGFLRERLDRLGGISDFDRGAVTGDGTATENQLAAAASEGREKFMQQQFNKSVVRVLRSAAWFMLNSQALVFPVPRPVDRAITGSTDIPGVQLTYAEPEMRDGIFQGGYHPSDGDISIEDLELEIQPMSMPLINSASLQRSLSQFYDWLIGVFFPGVVQFPFGKWGTILDDYAQSLNIPDGRKYVNWEALQAIAGVIFENMMQPQEIKGLDGAPPPDMKSLAGGGLKLGSGGSDAQSGNERGDSTFGGSIPLDGNNPPVSAIGA